MAAPAEQIVVDVDSDADTNAFEVPEPEIIYNEVTVESTVTTASQDDEDGTCAICFDAYSTTGLHRMCCLKCGHVFGRRCIEKWFQQNQANRAYGFCPTCKQRAKRRDIRDHFCRGTKVLDTSERDEAMKERDREREEKKKLQIELASLRQQRDTEVHHLQDELRELQRKVSNVREDGAGCSTFSSQPGTSGTVGSVAITPKSAGLRLQPMQKLDVCKEGESRVMDYASRLAVIVASAKSSACLFPGYGLTKINAAMLRCSKYIQLHTHPIRDVKFISSNDSLVLTASLDKTMKVTSVQSDTPVHKWVVNQPLWSCCWKSNDTNYAFAGTHNGKVKLYDSRRFMSSADDQGFGDTDTAIETFDCGNMGVTGLHWIESASNSNANSKGLLVSMLDRLMFLEQVNGVEYRPHVLLADEKFTPTSFHDTSRHFLTTFRPSPRRPNVEHTLHELAYGSSETVESNISMRYNCNIIRSFIGGSQQLYMCRNALFSHPNSSSNALIGATFDEVNEKLQLWDAAAGTCIAEAPKNLGSFDKMLHLAKYDFGDTHVVAALNSKSLYLYNLVES